MHFEDGACHVGLHFHVGTFVGIVAKVFGHAVAAAKQQGVKVFGLELLDGTDVASGQASGLGQDVALFLGLLVGQMVYDLGLRAVGRKALVFTMMLLDGEQKGDGLVDFAAILAATAGQDYCKFLHSV